MASLHGLHNARAGMEARPYTIPKESKYMKILKSVWLTICYPLLYLGAQLVVAGAYSVFAALFGTLLGLLMNPGAVMGDPSRFGETLLQGFDPLVPTALSSVAVLLSIYFINRWRWREKGFLRIQKGAAASLAFCTALGILGNAALNVIMNLLDVARFFPDYDAMMEMAMGGSPLFLVLAVVILAPLVEELIFRGLVMGHLLTKMKRPYAIALSSVIFGLIHLNPLQILYAALMGALLALIYVRAGTIWAAIFAHAGFNLVGVVAQLFMDDAVAAGLVLLMLYALSVAYVVVYLVVRARRQSS